MTEFTTWRSLVDGAEISAIPDIQGAQAYYDASEVGSVSEFEDDLSAEGHDLSPVGSPTLEEDEQNGLNVIRYNGDDEGHEVDWSTIDQPFHVFLVVRERSIDSDNSFYVSRPDDDGPSIYTQDNYRIRATDELTGGSTSTDWKILTAVFDGAESYLRVSGTEVISGDAGGENWQQFSIGFRDNAQFADIDVGELVVYPEVRDDEEDHEQHFSEKWGISI